MDFKEHGSNAQHILTSNQKVVWFYHLVYSFRIKAIQMNQLYNSMFSLSTR